MTKEITRFTEDAARYLLEAYRWGENHQVCPRCSIKQKAKWFEKRQIYRCMFCEYQFTVTTGTVFASHKLSLATILEAIIYFEDQEPTASDMKRALGVTYKTALILRRRIVEAKISHDGMLSEPGILTRWYWQGYNMWSSQGGFIVRANKHGDVRSAYTASELFCLEATEAGGAE